MDKKKKSTLFTRLFGNRNKVTDFIPNPTFERVAAPVCAGEAVLARAERGG